MTSSAFEAEKRAPGASDEDKNRRVMRRNGIRVLALSSLSDSDLIARLPALVQTERGAMADVIEHLVEMERRRLYLEQATSSLYRYCIERLGYPEDAALKRHRVARLAMRLPQVLEELRAGTIHLTGPVSALETPDRERSSRRAKSSRGRAAP